MNNYNNNLDDEFEVFIKAIYEFSKTVKNDIQLQIYVSETRKYIEFLITYYLRLGKLDEVRDRINELDMILLKEIENIENRINR
ncbi:hypothetical protein O2K51_03850 [Apibacter raozihei]|uniref:hypothetical protein n=1 Tax=Apibacter raozihei TaxID=2500547 RepID=UPI000FE2BF88|nr:hypothetical protein [Apibacter raozihei]